MAATRTSSDMVQHTIGRRFCAITSEPHSRGHAYFASRRQIAIGVGTCAYRIRGDMRGHPIAIYLITQSAPRCGSLATEPCMREALRLSGELQSAISTTRRVFKSRGHVRNSDNLHIRHSNLIIYQPRNVFNNDHATVARMFALRQPTSNTIRRRHSHLHAPQRRAQAPRFAFIDIKPGMANLQAQPLLRAGHKRAECRVFQAGLAIWFKASLAFSHSARAYQGIQMHSYALAEKSQPAISMVPQNISHDPV